MDSKLIIEDRLAGYELDNIWQGYADAIQISLSFGVIVELLDKLKQLAAPGEVPWVLCTYLDGRTSSHVIKRPLDAYILELNAESRGTIVLDMAFYNDQPLPGPVESLMYNRLSSYL